MAAKVDVSPTLPFRLPLASPLSRGQNQRRRSMTFLRLETTLSNKLAAGHPAPHPAGHPAGHAVQNHVLKIMYPDLGMPKPCN